MLIVLIIIAVLSLMIIINQKEIINLLVDIKNQMPNNLKKIRKEAEFIKAIMVSYPEVPKRSPEENRKYKELEEELAEYEDILGYKVSPSEDFAKFFNSLEITTEALKSLKKKHPEIWQKLQKK